MSDIDVEPVDEIDDEPDGDHAGPRDGSGRETLVGRHAPPSFRDDEHPEAPGDQQRGRGGDDGRVPAQRRVCAPRQRGRPSQPREQRPASEQRRPSGPHPDDGQRRDREPGRHDQEGPRLPREYLSRDADGESSGAEYGPP